MTVPVVLAIAGVIALLVGVLGGGIKAKELEIPSVSPNIRIIASVIGLILVSVAVWLSLPAGTSPTPNTLQPGETLNVTIQLTPTAIADETAQPANHPTPITKNVLIDLYHGTALPVLDGADGARLQAKGFSFDTSTQALTNDNLAPYDVLIISFAYYSSDEFARFSDVEIAAIKEYINQGGSVFFIGWGWVWSQYGEAPMEDYPLNQLLTGSGIFFTEYFVKHANGVSTKDVPLIFGKPNVLENHPITSGIVQISGGKSVPGTLLVEQPAIPLIWGDESITDSNGILKPIIMAASTMGKGKVVVLQHDAYIEPIGDAYDNVLLLENVLGWLSEQ